MLITSLDNDRIKSYIKLKDRKYRKKTKTFIVEGMHLVLEAYKSGNLIELILEKDEVLPIDVPTIYVTNEIINKISSLDNPSKVMGLCKMNDNKEVTGNKILLLDGVQDPGNLGTIIRSSVAFNISDIILSTNSVDLYNDKVIRSSEGMIYKINIIRTDLIKVIKKLKENNYLILGTNVRNGVDVKEVNSSRFALIMGNEGKGVKEEILNLCDKNLYIKMNKNCESLNLGVATGILLYELGAK